MGGMTRIFGEVADVYDEIRPGYPTRIAETILAYHGSVPASVVELGAGTGKGTEVLVELGAPLSCVEPDPRMSAILRQKFPHVDVYQETFEQWAPPPGGVPLIACAMAWHWLDEASRNQRVHDCLAPGGTLAVFGHKYAYVDGAQARAMDVAFRSVDPSVSDRAEGWLRADIEGSGVFTDIRDEVVSRSVEMSTAQYLQLVQTFSPFRKADPKSQADLLAVLTTTVDGFGGSVVLDLKTSVVLARRPMRS
jgi:trans-aconitate methyltransferase